MCVRSLADLCLYPCTPPTAPVSRSFGLRSSYEIAIFDTDLDFFQDLRFLPCKSRCFHYRVYLVQVVHTGNTVHTSTCTCNITKRTLRARGND
jgi:hypothetical protein